MKVRDVVLWMGAWVLMSSPVLAGACEESAGTFRDLRVVFPEGASTGAPVRVKFELQQDVLTAEFEVSSKELNAKPHLGQNEYPYQFDVVEVFVSTAGMGSSHYPYYEFELSPFDEDFQVKIVDPKKPFINGVQLGLVHEVQRSAEGWKAVLRIPLRNLDWDGDPAKIIGNAYAVLGAKPRRVFWGLTLPPQKKPNFHQPQFFRPLL